MADAGNVGAEGERPTLQRQKSQSKMSAREELKIVMQSRSFKRGEGGDAADMDDRADAQSAASGKSAKSLGKSSNYSVGPQAARFAPRYRPLATCCLLESPLTAIARSRAPLRRGETRSFRESLARRRRWSCQMATS